MWPWTRDLGILSCRTSLGFYRPDLTPARKIFEYIRANALDSRSRIHGTLRLPCFLGPDVRTQKGVHIGLDEIRANEFCARLIIAEERDRHHRKRP